jgi:PEP-CTERM motif
MKKLLLVLVLMCLPSTALAEWRAYSAWKAGIPIYGSVDGSYIVAEESWIGGISTILTFETGGIFEIYDNPAWSPEETVRFHGTVLASSLALGTYEPLLYTHEGSVITLNLELDYIWPDYNLNLDEWRYSTFTMTFNYPAHLIVTGSGFNAMPGVSTITPTPVPEPATLLLLGTGLVGAGIFGRKRVARKQS